MTMITPTICILGLFAAPLALAGNMMITGCTITAAGMVFNTAVNLTSSTTLNVSCTTAGSSSENGGAPSYTIGLSAGSSDNVMQRTMKQGSDVLKYNLYQDASYSSIWGDIASNWYSQSVNSTANNLALTIYGKIDTSSYQNAPAGNYSDPSIIMTITW